MSRRLDSWVMGLSKRRSRQGLYEFLEREYAAIPPKADVLSIGSGGMVNDLLMMAAQKNDFKVTTFDIDDARRPDIVGDLCDYDFGSRQFDVVVISEVLEHVTAPALGVKSLYKFLKTNGRLVLTTPFVFPMHDRPYDYFRYTRHGLEMLLKDFREVQVKERNSYFEAIDVLWVRLLFTDKPSARYAGWFFIPFIYYIKRPFTLLLGKLVHADAATTGYVVTAVK